VRYVAGAALVLVALGLRLPYIGLIPRFTDETDAVVLALSVARGEQLPLVDTDAYIGSGFIYILAAVLALLGPDPVLPRHVVLGMGILSLGAVALLGHELFLWMAYRVGGADAEGAGVGRAALATGFLAALFVIISPVHIVMNSRVAWSHATTPLFTTVGLWLVARAIRTAHGPSLALAGFCLGVALQTHPTVVALLPGCAVWVVWHARGRIDRRWLAIAATLGVLGAANLVAYNIQTGFGSLHAALATTGAYQAQQAEPTDYVGSLGLELGGLARLLTGAVGQRRGDIVPLTRPDVLVGAMLAAATLAYTVRRGPSLIPAVVIPFLLVAPMLNAKYAPLLNGRYLMPIAIVVWAVAAALLVRAWRSEHGPTWPRRLALGVVVAFLLGAPLASFVDFTRAALASGENRPYFDLTARIRGAVRPGERVLVDLDLGGERFASGRRGIGTVEYLLIMDPEPPAVLTGSAVDLLEALDAQRGGALLVLLPDARRTIEARFALQAIEPAPVNQRQRIDNAGLYRLRRAPR